MSNNNEQEFVEMIAQEEQPLYEAPASFNVTAIAPNGYDIQLTLRDVDAGKLMVRAMKALHWLDDNEFKPKTNGRYIPNPPPPATAPMMPAPAGEPEWKICEVHQVRMTRKGPGQGGDYWYSHKAMDPATGGEYWCKGKRRSGLVQE